MVNQIKLDVSIVPPELIVILAKSMQEGARKGYEKDSWRSTDTWEEHLAKAQRHIVEHNLDHLIDEESGLPHLFNAFTRLGMACVMYAEQRGMELGCYIQE